MKSQNIKNSDQLAIEVRSDYEKVEKDFDLIQSRLTPGQIIDDAIFYPHGGNLTQTIQHLKSNPIGTSLLTLGTILLMENEDHMSLEKSTLNKLDQGSKTVKRFAGKVKDRVSRKDPSLEGPQGLSEKLKMKVEEIKENVHQKASGAGLKAEEKFSSMIHSGKDRIKSGKDKIKMLDPLSLVAIGTGLGAMTSAIFPMSEFETNVVNPPLEGLGRDLREAINESSNILKDLVLGDLKGYNIDMFKS